MRTQQLPLDLGEMPLLQVQLWDQLPVEHQLAAVAALARLIAQATVREEKNPYASTADFPVA